MSDLLPTYPLAEDVNIQPIISSKKEFTELLPDGERIDSVYFNHQVFLQRFMTHFDSVLWIGDAGIGKTGGVQCVGEHFEENRGDIRGLYFITGALQQTDFIQQLVEKFAIGKYGVSKARGRKTGMPSIAGGARRIDSWYHIMTYESLAKQINSRSNEELIRDFSGYVFVIDEVQLVKISPVIDNPDVASNWKPRSRLLTYAAIYRLFHLAVGIKRIVMTASPITNMSEELIYIINLILPKDVQIETPISRYVRELATVTGNVKWVNLGDMDKVSIDDLEPLIRGRVMHIRAPDTGTVAVYPDDSSIPDLNYKLKILRMSDFQKEGYYAQVSQLMAESPSLDADDAEGDEEPTDIISPETGKIYGGLFPNQKQASNFRFPDGSVGSVGYSRYVKRSGERDEPKEELITYLSDSNDLYRSSCKMAFIVNGATTMKGKRYIVADYIVGGGANILGWALKYSIGKFTETYGISTSISSLGGIISEFSPSNRYAIISSKTKSNHAQNILNLYNHPSNWDGKYLKVLIITRAGQVGTNLADVSHVDILDGSYVPNVKYQSIMRAFRATSHVVTRQAMTKYYPDLPVGFPILVNVNLLTADPGVDSSGKPIWSVEVHLYKLCQKKDKLFSRLMRMLKIIAVDCSINRSRNIRKSDANYTPETDYEKREYEPYNSKIFEEDVSTYNALYSSKKIENIKLGIINYLATSQSITVEEICRVGQESEYHVIQAINSIMANANPVCKDRFGYDMHIVERDATYYASRKPQTEAGGFDDSYYDHCLISRYNKSTPEIVESFVLKKMKAEIAKIYKAGRVTDAEIYGYTSEERAILFEDAVSRYESPDYSEKRDGDIVQTILESTNKLWKHLPDQYDNVSSFQKYFFERRKAAKPKAGYSEFNLEVNVDEEGPHVWIHYIYGLDVRASMYGVIRKATKYSERLRIFRFGKWRDLTFSENYVYSTILTDISTDYMSVMTDNNIGIMGLIASDQLHILDLTSTEDTSLAGGKSRKTGRMCTAHDKLELAHMLWKIGYRPPGEEEEIPETLSVAERQSLLEKLDSRLGIIRGKLGHLVDSWTDSQLLYFNVIKNWTQKRMCMEIGYHLRDMDLLVDWFNDAPRILENLGSKKRRR